MSKDIIKDVKDFIDLCSKNILNLRVRNWSDFVDRYTSGIMDETTIKSFKLTPELYKHKVIEDLTIEPNTLFIDLKDGKRGSIYIPEQPKTASTEAPKEKKRARKKA